MDNTVNYKLKSLQKQMDIEMKVGDEEDGRVAMVGGSGGGCCGCVGGR